MKGGGPYRTLLVDDTVSLRKLFRLTLERSGHFVVVGEAGHGIHATKLAGELRPDLVLLDVSMPVQDGMAALPHILSAAPDTKVVMLSGFEAQRLAPAAISQGASAYLEKGSHPTRMIDELLKVMSEGPDAATDGAPRVLEQSAAVIPPEELMSFVAHELRSSITLIQGFGTALISQWSSLSEDARYESAARMTEGSRRLESVLNNMLCLRALESGPLPVHMTVESGEALVRSLARDLEYLSVDHPFDLVLGDDLPMVKVDVVRLQQVLTNLVVNAAKFSPPHTPITLRARTAGRDLLIQVADQGPGVPADMREAVFAKFARATSTSPGVGLGLHISRKLMESMSGEVWIEDSLTGAVVSCLLRGEDWSKPDEAAEPEQVTRPDVA